LLVNRENTRRLAVERGVPAARIAVINPGTEVPDPDPEAGARFRRTQGLEDRELLLSVGRLTLRKGLAEFVERALPAIVARHPRACLVVVGEEASDALHGSRGSERERIAAAARAGGVEAQLRFIGRLAQEDLEGAYRGAQVHVFPVLDQPGDVEGFGMVALESAARGLPTVAFAVGGVPDAVADGITGRLVPPGDYAALADAVCAQLESGAGPGPECIAFARARDWEAFGRRLRALLGAADG
jgi:phosphatidylinositol alpha-1,6-mannosyltransferase